MKHPETMNYLVLHLDLGIGGAEKLMVNIALALWNASLPEGNVTILTTHHDIHHCFEETKPLGILGRSIFVHGDFIPTGLFGGKFTALCAIFRMIYLSFITLFYCTFGRRKYDAIIIDGVSAPIPILRLTGLPIMFYCHYPDKFLCVERGSLLKQFYRMFVDRIEEITTFSSDLIVVNSKFTAQAFARAFPRLGKYYQPQVLYPTIEEDKSPIDTLALDQKYNYTAGFDAVFISLNRYERKKSIETALFALDELRYLLTSSHPAKRILLVVAGGYDERVTENREYLQELVSICKAKLLSYRIVVTNEACNKNHQSLSMAEEFVSNNPDSISCQVVFRVSISNDERRYLLWKANGLLYTPENEHFGIVPIEAMYCECPVIAVNSGGPLETVITGHTGILCSPTGACFANAMKDLLDVISNVEETSTIAMQSWRGKPIQYRGDLLGYHGRNHVKNHFLNEAMQRNLHGLLDSMVQNARTEANHGSPFAVLKIHDMNLVKMMMFVGMIMMALLIPFMFITIRRSLLERK